VSRAAYDEIAHWYNEIVREGPQSLHEDFVIPALLEVAGDIGEWRVCDLACGQGVVARGLAERGASVVGVDISEKLLDIARRYEREQPLGISYLLDDAQTLLGVESAGFDGVVCNMALMDIPDLIACLGSVARILRPAGWFVFSITHPCFLPPNSPRWTHDEDGTISLKVSGYFAEGFWKSSNPDGVRGKVGSHHRTLSTYVNALARAGLKIEHLDEPRATEDMAERIPGYLEVPPYLVARCEKRETEDYRP
jgi:ubiquinone/menaquinone biosynthesis C-methylase UbiE